jgi:ferredoxin-NADP reductase
MAAENGPTGLPRLPWRVATVVEVVDETARARTLRLDVPGWPGHRAGQHVDVRLTAPDGYRTERSYSIASAPPSMNEHATGATIRGPVGGYFVWTVKEGGPLFLIAGGSGVVPLAAMIRLRASRGATVPALLLYSARLQEALFYRAELDALAADGTGFRVEYSLTRERPADWRGFTRRVDREMLAQVGWSAAERPRIFICGPTAFVEAVASACVALGHAPERIKTERFGPTGT